MGDTAVRSMAVSRERKFVIPVVLGLAMLSVVVADVLASDTTGVQFQTGSQPSWSNVSLWVYLGAGALVVAPSLLLALFLLRRRRYPAIMTAQPSTDRSVHLSSPRRDAASLARVVACGSAHLGSARGPGSFPSAIPVAATGVDSAVAFGGWSNSGGIPKREIDSLLIEFDKISWDIERRGLRNAGQDRAPVTPPRPGRLTENGNPQTELSGLPGDEQRPNGPVRTPESSHLEALWVAHATAAFHIRSGGASEVGRRHDGPPRVTPWKKPPTF
jgi:hypothetical protein